MEDNITKINFFKKVWYSITKISKYEDMRKEGLGKSLRNKMYDAGDWMADKGNKVRDVEKKIHGVKQFLYMLNFFRV